MNYSFEYIDIILLAMIAGFIFLRLRGILGKRTGFEGKASPQFEEMLKNINPETKIKKKIVIFSAIDNLVKGASGQAIQNLNLMFGIDQTTGLKLKGSTY